MARPIPADVAAFLESAERGETAAPEPAAPPKKRRRVDIEALYHDSMAEERAAAAWRNFGLPAADQPVLFFPKTRSR
jgi:hypothetical protein